VESIVKEILAMQLKLKCKLIKQAIKGLLEILT
jgi:hypothetical protein